MGFIPSEPFPSAEPCTFRLPYPLAVSDIACSCSEDQKATMPRNSRALLPAKIRTRLKRCARGPILSWDSSLFDSRSSRCGHQWPGTRPARMESKARGLHVPANKAVTAGGRSDSIGPTSIRRAFTRTCPRALPTTAVSCQITPTSSELALLVSSPGLRGQADREPEGTRKSGS
jgi:hypothetical protein